MQSLNLFKVFQKKKESLTNFVHFINLIGLSSGQKCMKIISERNNFNLDQCAVARAITEISYKPFLQGISNLLYVV